MGRWNDPERDDNAEALKSRLAAARAHRGKASTASPASILAGLLLLGVVGGVLVFLGFL